MTSPPLRFSAVSFRYPDAREAALDGVTLDVGAGEGVAILGRNGAGKTTLLRLAMGLLPRGATGEVAVGGLPAIGARPEDLARRAGYLFQDPESQLFRQSVRAEVAFGPECLGWAPARVAERVAEALEEVGLAGIADEHPWNLPGPLRRLVALAAVLANDPAVLLLDEPTAGLDRETRRLVRGVVLRRRAAGVVVVAVTHDGEFALEALDRGIILERGRIVAEGDVAGLLGREDTPPAPASLLVARGLGLDIPVPRFDGVAAALAQHCRILT